MSRLLLLLRVLIFAGALASVVQPPSPYRLEQVSLIVEGDTTTRTLAPDQRSLVRVAFTVIGLALL